MTYIIEVDDVRAKIPMIIIGTGPFAEIAYEYFKQEACFNPVAFTAEKDYLKEKRIFDLPVIPFEYIEEVYDPKYHVFYAAIAYGKMNNVRTRLYFEAKSKGYAPINYISPYAFIGPKASVGEHCFIFEDNTIQPFAKVGNNVVIWSGNHIGHHSEIGDNCFIASHAVVSGNVRIGNNCFIGVNATIVNDIEIGNYVFVGAGVIVTDNVIDGARLTTRTVSYPKGI